MFWGLIPRSRILTFQLRDIYYCYEDMRFCSSVLRLSLGIKYQPQNVVIQVSNRPFDGAVHIRRRGSDVYLDDKRIFTIFRECAKRIRWFGGNNIWVKDVHSISG